MFCLTFLILFMQGFFVYITLLDVLGQTLLNKNSNSKIVIA